MSINRLHIKGYRSIRDLSLELKPINVVLGANGTGKSNLYKALYLLYAAAEGNLARSLADEGGMNSALWAGKLLESEKARISIEVEIDDMTYQLVVGRVPQNERIGTYAGGPPGADAMKFFYNDPDIKTEQLSVDYRGKSITLLDRKHRLITARNMDGRKVEFPLAVDSCESALAGLREPHLFPEISQLRSRILNWRFYHCFDTSAQALMRQPQVPAFTPVLGHDGSDLVSVLATVMAIDNAQLVQDAVNDAFPGASVFPSSDGDFLELVMNVPGIDREFKMCELSDGTLQYLCLLAALLSPRPPSLLALNEPESSIHPDLFSALAKLIIYASKNSQIWITTHSTELARYIDNLGGGNPVELVKLKGATSVFGSSDDS